MKKLHNHKFAIIAFSLITLSSQTLLFGMKFSMTFKGDELKVNGQTISTKQGIKSAVAPISDIALSFVFGYTITKLAEKSNLFPKNKLVPHYSFVAGDIVGSVVNDMIFGKLTTKSVLKKVVPATGMAAGVCFRYQDKGVIIKEPEIVGSKVGKMIVSKLYGKHKKTMILIGEVVGGEIGERALMRGIGSYFGVAAVSYVLKDTELSSRYIKKELYRAASTTLAQEAFNYVLVEPDSVPAQYLAERSAPAQYLAERSARYIVKQAVKETA